MRKLVVLRHVRERLKEIVSINGFERRTVVKVKMVVAGTMEICNDRSKGH